MPSRILPGLSLRGGWSQGEDEWGQEMNDNLRKLSVYTQLYVLDKDLTVPPGFPNNGDVYIVADGATGEWAGQDGNLAVRDNGQWVFLDDIDGLIAFVEDEGLYYKNTASGRATEWTPLVPATRQKVAFQAYTSVNRIIGKNSWTVVQMNAVVHNDQSAFSTSTGRFTAPVNGYYDLSFHYQGNNNNQNAISVGAGLGINGADPTDRNLVVNHDLTGDPIGSPRKEEENCSVRSVLKLAQGDYVQPYAWMSPNGTDSTAVILQNGQNSFSGHEV